MSASTTGAIRLAFVLGMLTAAGCSRVEPQARPAKASHEVMKPAPVASAPRPVGGKFELPDYAAQAKEQTNREQQLELKTKAQALKVELPPKTK
jgi:hypothetical protein